MSWSLVRARTRLVTPNSVSAESCEGWSELLLGGHLLHRQAGQQRAQHGTGISDNMGIRLSKELVVDPRLDFAGAPRTGQRRVLLGEWQAVGQQDIAGARDSRDYLDFYQSAKEL
jgi:hypothetical protein